jgi:hypothetical protein
MDTNILLAPCELGKVRTRIFAGFRAALCICCAAILWRRSAGATTLSFNPPPHEIFPNMDPLHELPRSPARPRLPNTSPATSSARRCRQTPRAQSRVWREGALTGGAWWQPREQPASELRQCLSRDAARHQRSAPVLSPTPSAPHSTTRISVTMQWRAHQPNPHATPGPDFKAMNRLAADRCGEEGRAPLIDLLPRRLLAGSALRQAYRSDPTPPPTPPVQSKPRTAASPPRATPAPSASPTTSACAGAHRVSRAAPRSPRTATPRLPTAARPATAAPRSGAAAGPASRPWRGWSRAPTRAPGST